MFLKTASGQSDSYLLFSHGKVIYELPFKPSQQNPGKRIVNAPGKNTRKW